MTGAGLMDFIIGLIGLAILVTLIFLGLDKVSSDEQFKKIARYAIGGVALILALYAVKGFLFGGGGIFVTGPGLIDFAIGLIILLVGLVFLYMLVDWFAPEKVREPAKFVIGALAIIVILMLAQRSLSGPGAGYYHPLFGPNFFAPEHR